MTWVPADSLTHSLTHTHRHTNTHTHTYWANPLDLCFRGREGHETPLVAWPPGQPCGFGSQRRLGFHVKLNTADLSADDTCQALAFGPVLPLACALSLTEGLVFVRLVIVSVCMCVIGGALTASCESLCIFFPPPTSYVFTSNIHCPSVTVFSCTLAVDSKCCI